MTAFFTIMLPIGIIWSIIALILMYWISKYNLLRRNTVTYRYGSKYGKEVIEMLGMIIPIYAGASIMSVHLTVKD